MSAQHESNNRKTKSDVCIKNGPRRMNRNEIAHKTLYSINSQTASKQDMYVTPKDNCHHVQLRFYVDYNRSRAQKNII